MDKWETKEQTNNGPLIDKGQINMAKRWMNNGWTMKNVEKWQAAKTVTDERHLNAAQNDEQRQTKEGQNADEAQKGIDTVSTNKSLCVDTVSKKKYYV